MKYILGVLFIFFFSCQHNESSIERAGELVSFSDLTMNEKAGQSRGDFWKKQRRGTNLFDELNPFSEEDVREKFKEIKRQNLDFVRLTPSKWKSFKPGSVKGDFLIGAEGGYKGLYMPDLKRLIRVLDIAQEERVKVLLVFLNIPGRRWRQHTKNLVQVRKIWKSFEAQELAIDFFEDVIAQIGQHKALVGINPMNEPQPEQTGVKYSGETKKTYLSWYEKIKGTPQDINLFYKKVVEKIRHWSRDLPIILEASDMGGSFGFHILEPQNDPHLYYSFHMYEPFRYTFKRVDASYPGFIPYPRNKQWGESWNKKKLESTMVASIKEWQKKNRVPSDRIIVGEFGVHRDARGSVNYMRDLVSLFEENKWHHAYYSFHEDNWKVMFKLHNKVAERPMNYDLGTGKPHELYYKALEKNMPPNYRLMPESPFRKFLSPISSKKPPVLGWNSWNWFGKKGISEKVVEEVILAMKKQGFQEAGYTHIVVDGGWRDKALGPKGDLVLEPTRFPKGMKHLSDLAHKNGFKFGLHIVPGTHDCGNDPVGSFGKEELHIKQLIDWDVDFIKLDACVYKGSTDWPDRLLEKTVKKWKKLLKQFSTKKITLSVNAMSPQDWYPDLSQSGRTTEDLKPKVFGGASFDSPHTGAFLSIMDVAEANNRAQALAGHGYWNDADMLMVSDPSLTQKEMKTHFSLWALMTAPLFLGNDPRNLSNFDRDLILNKEIIAINQDTTEQGYRIKQEGGLEYWRKRLQNGSSALLVLNRGKKAQNFSIDQRMALIPVDFTVEDLFSKKTSKPMKTYKGKIAGGQSLFFKVSLPN